MRMGSYNLDELRKKFIVDEAEYESQRLKEHVEKVLELCQITSSGRVIIKKKDMTNKDKVGLVILARYLGHYMKDEINELVSADDISKYTRLKKTIVNARGKDIVDEGYALRPETGIYKMNPGMIDEFLEKLRNSDEE